MKLINMNLGDMSLTEMSFAAAVMILAIIVVRALAINKLPKKVFLLLWDVVLLRLLIPFSIPSVFSAYTFVQRSEPIREAITQAPTAGMIAQVTGAPVNAGISSEATVPSSVQSISPLAIIWSVGFLVCVAFFVVSYVRCHREFQTSLPVKNEFTLRWLRCHRLKRRIQIRQSDRINAPLTYGILKPVILMPKRTDWENRQQLEYVLLHEYTHICRFDMVTKLIAALALCIHWFNPFVWAMYILFNRDIELSCDESVVRRFGENTKSFYAKTLISMEEKKSSLTPLYNSFSRNAIEERITAIMKTKKVTIGILVVSVLVILAIVIPLATSAKDSEAEEQNVEKVAGHENLPDVSEKMEYGLVAEAVSVTGTPLEMAKEVVAGQFTQMQDFGYSNWRIDSLTEEYAYGPNEEQNLGDMLRVSVYRLEYAFLAEDSDQVTLTGGMTIDEDGWVVPEYPGSTYLCLVADGGALSYVVLTENDCFPGDEVFTDDLKQLLNLENTDESYLEIVEANEKKITEQIADIIGEAESVRYTLENYELEIHQAEGNRVDCTFWADWKSVREAEDDPLIQGLYQAVEALSDKEEKDYATEIADGWLVEVQSWQVDERLNTEIAVLVTEADSWGLYYKYVMDGQEELIPLQKYAEENWTENEEERRQQGIDIIEEAIRFLREE